MTPDRVLRVLRPGLVPYARGLELQARLVAERLSRQIPDTLVVLEHPPVITLGHRGDRSNILAAPEELARLGIEVHGTTRGGDVTYHGPGQLVAYPIVDIDELHLSVASLVGVLEQAMIRTAAAFGVTAGRVEGIRGVFVGSRKLGSVGLHVSRGVTSHGLALNVRPSLAHFELIVPCGLRDHGVTSLELAAGRQVSQSVAEGALVRELAALLGLRPLQVAAPPGG